MCYGNINIDQELNVGISLLQNITKIDGLWAQCLDTAAEETREETTTLAPHYMDSIYDIMLSVKRMIYGQGGEPS